MHIFSFFHILTPFMCSVIYEYLLNDCWLRQFHFLVLPKNLNSNYIAITACDEHQCHRFQDIQNKITFTQPFDRDEITALLKYKCIRPPWSIINFLCSLAKIPIPLLSAYEINIDPKGFDISKQDLHSYRASVKASRIVMTKNNTFALFT